MRAQAGNLGDIGYEVHSRTLRMGGALASDRPVVTAATLTRGSLVVDFQTLGELALEGFEVVARDARGRTMFVAAVECVECSSGIGSDYRVEVPVAGLRSARSVYVVAQPSGTASNEMTIARPTQPPGNARGTR